MSVVGKKYCIVASDGIFGTLSSLINHFIGFLDTSWCSHMLALLLVIIEINTVCCLPLTNVFHTGYNASHCTSEVTIDSQACQINQISV